MTEQQPPRESDDVDERLDDDATIDGGTPQRQAQPQEPENPSGPSSAGEVETGASRDDPQTPDDGATDDGATNHAVADDGAAGAYVAGDDVVDDDVAGDDAADGGAADRDDEPEEDSEESDDGIALREYHAWQVSAEAVRSLPPEALLAPAPERAAPVADDTAPDDGGPAQPAAAGASAPAVHGRPTGWAALGSALRPRATRAQVLAGVLCAVLGFAIVVQLRQNGDSALSQLRQDDLVRLLDESSTRSDQLSREAADLQRERDQLVSGSNNRQAAIDAARRSAATQGILAGRLPAVGPGVRITVSDTGASVRPITMLNMLEELRNAGAEAVQLNDHRITASSAFTGSAGAVQLDGSTLTAPYVWLVIGDPDTIATALDIPGGAMAYVRNDGGSGSVDKLTEVHVDALRSVADPRYATPVAVPGS